MVIAWKKQNTILIAWRIGRLLCKIQLEEAELGQWGK